MNFDLADLEIINDQTAIVITAEYDKGSGLLITNNQVESWRLLYRLPDERIFFNSIAFV